MKYVLKTPRKIAEILWKILIVSLCKQILNKEGRPEVYQRSIILKQVRTIVLPTPAVTE
jgi:hypothetical protein